MEQQTAIRPLEIKPLEIKPCPFCGGKMKFFREQHRSKNGRAYTAQFWAHEDDSMECALDQICEPFTIPARDARFDENGVMTYPGEYAERWNKRA